MREFRIVESIAKLINPTYSKNDIPSHHMHAPHKLLWTFFAELFHWKGRWIDTTKSDYLVLCRFPVFKWVKECAKRDIAHWESKNQPQNGTLRKAQYSVQLRADHCCSSSFRANVSATSSGRMIDASACTCDNTWVWDFAEGLLRLSDLHCAICTQQSLLSTWHRWIPHW